MQLFAQEVDTISSVILDKDTTKITFQIDSLRHMDSVKNFRLNDSILLKADSVMLKKKSKNAITDKVDSKSEDSIVLDLRTKKVYLYNNAEVHYQNIQLKANYIETGFQSKIIIANGIPDSMGKPQGNPEFIESGQSYKSKKITYNFDSKRGIIDEIITQQGEGYLHGYKAKKDNDTIMYLESGIYTTCDLEEPHFGIELSKAKVITGDRVITGPAYLSIENVPTPLVIPFGFFPFTKKRSSGIIIPSYGYAQNRGYYLNHGGYYFALSDYYDLSLLGDIYTNGSWSLNAISNYNRRYKYNGLFDVKYERIKQGVKNTPGYSEIADFRIRWRHEQDRKANPKSNFSAEVDFVSPHSSKWSTNATDYFTNTTTSSVAYSRQFGDNVYFTANLGETYNTNTKIYDFDLPTISLNTNQFFPFRSKNTKGNYKWYENINVKYTMSGKNNINSPDSTLLKNDIWKRMNNGIQQSIPISSSIRIFKHFNWDNNITYTERWYLKSIRKNWDPDSNRVQTDTVWGFASNREANFSSSINTKLYGMVNFKNQYIKALRHVMTPSLTFNFRPNFGNPNFGYWKSYVDSAGRKYDYSIFEGSTYGGPPNGKSGSLGLRISNNLEMKIKSKSDTVTGTKKIVLIEDFSISMSYDLAKDSLNWSPLILSGRTTLFKNLSITYSAGFIPYCTDTNGNMYNEFLWKKEGRLFRRTNTTWNVSLNWSLNSKKKETQNPQQDPIPKTDPFFESPFNNPNEILGNTVDFSIPWNLNISYNLVSANNLVYRNNTYTTETTQTLGLTGDFNLTPIWKIGFATGYDFKLKEVTYTSIDFYVDLHCWEMRCNWVPFGFRKGWNFTIAIKANSLKDLKYEMKSDFRNTQPYL